MNRPRRATTNAKKAKTTTISAALVPPRRTRSRQDIPVEPDVLDAGDINSVAEDDAASFCFTAGSFDLVPLEVLHYICELTALDGLNNLGVRKTLNSLRLVNRRMCIVASRVAHAHVIVSRADHARHLLGAILADAKKSTRGVPAASKTTFYAQDIRALTIEDRGEQDSATVSVLMRLPTAIRRLPKLRALTWATNERPTLDIIRALAKAPAFKQLELCDTAFVNPGPGYNNARMTYAVGYARVSLFPQGLGNLPDLTRLTLRLKVNADGQYGGKGKWYEFCEWPLKSFASLHSLVIEMAGTYPAEISALCRNEWPALRSLALKGVRFYSPVESFLTFLGRHPKLEELDINDPEWNPSLSQWPTVINALQQVATNILPNLRRLAVDAHIAAGFVQTLLLKGFRPLREVHLLRSSFFDPQYYTVKLEDGPHVAMRNATVEILTARISSNEDLLALASDFPNLYELHLDVHLQNWPDDMMRALVKIPFSNLRSLEVILDQPRVDVDAIELQTWASQLAACFPSLRELHVRWQPSHPPPQYSRSCRLRWTNNDGNLEGLEVDDNTSLHQTVQWPILLPADKDPDI